MMKLYHATPTRNIRSILSRGLLVSEGSPEGGIFLARSLEEVIGFAGEWAEEPGETRKWAIFEIEGLESKFKTEGPPEYEIYTTDSIPPNRLKLLGIYDAWKGVWD